MRIFNFVMTFLNASDKSSTITRKNVKPDLTAEEIRTAMIVVLDNNIFDTPLGDLKLIKSVVIIETVKDQLI